MKKINRFTFDFNIEPKDYRETITAVTFGIQRWKRIGIFCVWVVMAVLFLLNLLKVIRLSNVVYTCSLMVTVVVAAAYVTMLIGMTKYTKQFKSGKNIKRRVIVDDEGFVFKNRSTEESGSNPWSDVFQIKELENYYMIGVNARDAVIIPKRAILTEKEDEDFRELIREKVGNRFFEM
ncbi:MAG: YcxB family protein [Solobacterium sp.]|nr:YcxB family protein [Solobacterium sp.]